MAAAAAPRVLIFPSCANFCFFSHFLLKVLAFFVQFGAFLHDFDNFFQIFCVLIFQTHSFACAIL